MAELIIKDWQKGIGPSPHFGFGNICNCDISNFPGVLRINLATAKKTGTTVTARPNWIVRNPLNTAEIYSLDTSGKIYKSADSGATWADLPGNVFAVSQANPAVFSATAHGLVQHDTVVLSTTGALYTGLVAGTTYYVIAGGLTADAFELSLTDDGTAVQTSGSQNGTHTFRITTSMHGNGLAIWKGHLFVARDAELDVMNLTTGVWTNNWKAITSDNLWHPMIVSSNDNKLYGGAGKYVYSLDEETTFVPATGASYTWTATHLDLPPNYRIKCLEELGNNLMCGTWMGSDLRDFKIANIFPWDRSSSSYDLPLKLNENGVNALITINNLLYILVGISGKIFYSNGVQIVPIAQIPSYVADYENLYYEFLPGAVMNHRGRLFFSISNAVTGGIVGIFSLNGNVLNLEHLISTGGDGSTSIVQIGALLSLTNSNFLAGWKDGTAYGIDSLAYRYTGYTVYAESPLYPVGTPLAKGSFSKIAFQLVKELASGQGIRIKYRVNLTDSFTTIRTYVYSGTASISTIVVGNVMSFFDDIKLTDLDFLQIRVELTTGASSSTTPELKAIILQ